MFSCLHPPIIFCTHTPKTLTGWRRAAGPGAGPDARPACLCTVTQRFSPPENRPSLPRLCDGEGGGEKPQEVGRRSTATSAWRRSRCNL